MKAALRFALAAGVSALALSGFAAAVPFEDIDQEPIRYSTTEATDPIAQLDRKIRAGEVELKWDAKHGYLPAILAALKVPRASQTLVFSKTSFQRDYISPATPRAVYFADEVYVGTVRGSRILEFSAADPLLGGTFYAAEQFPDRQPRFVRQTHECLQCHSSALTLGVPGHLVRSVRPDPAGQPIFSLGTYLTSDESPFDERWGGWYVTGTHGALRHLGNQVFRTPAEAESPNLSQGANVTDLRSRFDTEPYLTPHSDIVALMVLQHQSRIHNLITRAAYQTRMALRYEALLNKDLGRAAGYRAESTLSRVRSVTDPLTRGLLFARAEEFRTPIKGSTDFAAEFSAAGRRDSRGRSLRDFDLQTRLLRYSCSFLIDTPSFDALPDLAREMVYRKIWEVVEGKESSDDYRHLTPADRRAIGEMLTELKPEFTRYRPRAT